jgi:hypothetical protein
MYATVRVRSKNQFAKGQSRRDLGLSLRSCGTYFPRMEPNEAIFLKRYDSMYDGRARFTTHISFDEPNSLPNAAPRESIEVRARAFWASETA